ncbi:MAG: 16S rRNA (uracil(1498)-N(3))-methyltransferase [Chloroflexi bacterium]|nr:16S rRNA (uracil(1498)-N(3))-methyltransferase [Chloroflexota bacterium]
MSVGGPHRFFVPPGTVRDGTVRFSRDQAHQISTVLRMDVGDRVIVLDNSGWSFTVTLSLVRRGETTGSVIERSLVTSEPRTKITLYFAMIRTARLEMTLQKCTELGVVAFVPILTERCIAGDVDDLTSRKIERWNRIIAEAAEQSGRGKLPALLPTAPFDTALDGVRGTSLILWEGERTRTLRDALPSGGRSFAINVFVGPEGGFTDREIDRARTGGVVPTTLGPRILRAETASIAVVSALLFTQADLG